MWGAGLQRHIDVSVSFLKENNSNLYGLEAFLHRKFDSSVCVVWWQQRNCTFQRHKWFWCFRLKLWGGKKEKNTFCLISKQKCIQGGLHFEGWHTNGCSIMSSAYLWCACLYGGDLQSDFMCSFIRITVGGWDRERLWEHLWKVVDANLNAWRGLATIKWTDWNSNRICE